MKREFLVAIEDISTTDEIYYDSEQWVSAIRRVLEENVDLEFWSIQVAKI